MSNRCHVCGTNTIFYVWTSSRNFPREQLFKKMNIKSNKVKNVYRVSGYPVCLECLEKLKKE